MSSDQEEASHTIVGKGICRIEERPFLEAEKPTIILFFFFSSSFPPHILYCNIPSEPAVTVFLKTD